TGFAARASTSLAEASSAPEPACGLAVSAGAERSAVVASMLATSSASDDVSSGPSPGATSSSTGFADNSAVTMSASSSLVIASSSIRWRICGVSTRRWESVLAKYGFTDIADKRKRQKQK